MKSTAELRLLLGMTPVLFACLEPAITVYTQAPEPDHQHLTTPARAAWTRYLLDQHREAPQTTANVDSAGDPSGQVFRFTVEVHDGRHERAHWVNVGRLTGDGRAPWVTLDRWVADSSLRCDHKSITPLT